jgi:hypothetical protein
MKNALSHLHVITAFYVGISLSSSAVIGVTTAVLGSAAAIVASVYFHRAAARL